MKNFLNVRVARESKIILNSAGFQSLGFSLFEWNLDSGFQSFVGSGFLELYSAVYSRFQNQESWIPQLGKFFWIPDSISKLKISRIPGVLVLLTFACVPMNNLKLILINS